MIKLPVAPSAPKTKNAKRMLIASQPKVGKTSAVMALPNCLVIDLESGADQYPGMSIDVNEIAKKISAENDIPYLEAKLEAYFSVVNEIKNMDHKYDYIAIDNTTRLEDMASYYATMLYKKSTIGKNFKGEDVVSELPSGGGYLWLREAFDRLVDAVDGLPRICNIYIGHLKKSSITKNDQSITALDLELSGKGKTILTSLMDANGFLRREKSTNKNILSFKTSETDLLTGARTMHLRGNEFLLSELTDDGKFITYWDKIFLKQ